MEIAGLNLEKLLRESQQAALVLKDVRREGERRMFVCIKPWDRAVLLKICDRFGWEAREVRADPIMRLLRFARRRWALVLGGMLCCALLLLSSNMVLGIRVTGAGIYEAEVRRFLSGQRIFPGRFKSALSTDGIREGLLIRLPGLSYVGVRYAGSMLEIDCRLVREGENLEIDGDALDLVAMQDGVITRIVVSSGTPVVREGDVVFAGQVLVKGEERTQAGATVPVRAKAQVCARVWAVGEARASLERETTRETGRRRTRITLHTPWHTRMIEDALPFAVQETSVVIEPVIDLFIPLWRRYETYHEIETVREARQQSDAAGIAQGAAEIAAKKQLPAGVLILDKWVDYSMIDNEFVYASVVLEYERDIAVRTDGK